MRTTREWHYTMSTNNMTTVSDAALLLENQLCFPLYACAKEVVRRYKPLLDALDLTYTQYITMMVLWEDRQISCKELGQRLHLDSGTLTPLLKRLKAKGYVITERLPEDERVVMVTVTDKGMALHDEALTVPAQMAGCVCLEPHEAIELYRLLNKMLNAFDNDPQ